MEAAIGALRKTFIEREEGEVFFRRAFQLSTLEEVAQEILKNPLKINHYIRWETASQLLTAHHVKVSSVDFADYCDRDPLRISSEGVDKIHKLLLAITTPEKIDLERFM